VPKYTSDAELDSWFSYHSPSSPTIARGHERIRTECRRLAGVLSNLLPEGPDKQVALRAVRTVMFEANACIAAAQRLNDPDFQAGTADVPARGGPDQAPEEGL
jgi:hypothetical protein